MTSNTDLEQALRGLLRDQLPDVAPGSLRARVERIPEAQRLGGWSFELVRSLLVPATAIGLAVVAVAVAASGVTRAPVDRMPPGGAGGIPAGFDPSITGLGMLTGIVPLAMLLGGALAISCGAFAAGVFFSARSGTNRGRAFVLLGLLGVAAGIWLVRLDIGLTGGNVRGAPLGFVEAATEEYADVTTWYETAEPGEPIVVVFSIYNDSAVPVRIDGLVMPSGHGTSSHWTALWLPPVGQEAGAPGLELVRPFQPVDLAPGGLQVFYLSGRAGLCAFGRTFDPDAEYQEGQVGGYTESGPTFTVAYSVFGVSNAAEVDIGERMLEPLRGGCSPV
jgi:hypothetical protein